MSYRTRPVTQAVIDALTAAGMSVGDGEKPATGGWAGVAGQSNFRSYVVVHPVGATLIDGTFDAPSDDVWPLWQITAYGANRAQCEQIADDARAVMLDSPLDAGGRRIGTCHVELQGVVTRVDDVQPPIYMSPDRYSAFSTPT